MLSSEMSIWVLRIWTDIYLIRLMTLTLIVGQNNLTLHQNV